MGICPPGRPNSLGRAADLRDARGVLSVAGVCRKALAAGRPRSGPARVLREALWFLWEAPRLPRPAVASKYPCAYPWSPLARARVAEHKCKRPPGGWGLVIEHLYPREFLVAALLDDSDVSTAAATVELLTERLMAAVITREEDRELPAHATAALPWEDYAADPWLRYKQSGLELARFAPLAVCT